MNAAQLLRDVADLVDAGLPAPRGVVPTEVLPAIHVRGGDSDQWRSVLHVAEEPLATRLDDGRVVNTAIGTVQASGQRVDLVWTEAP